MLHRERKWKTKGPHCIYIFRPGGTLYTASGQVALGLAVSWDELRRKHMSTSLEKSEWF